MGLSLKEMLAVGIPYSLACGALYTFGYWGAFGVNALEFISFADLGKLAVYPLGATLGLVVLMTLTSQIIQGSYLPPGGGNDTPIGKLGFRHWRLIVVLLIFSTVLMAMFGPEPARWLFVASMSPFFAAPLSHVPALIRVFPNARARSVILGLALLVPALSFAFGRMDASGLKAGWPRWTVDTSRSKLLLDSDAKNPVAYLGVLGDVYVLRETKTKELIFVKQNEDSPLFLISKQ